MRVGVILSVYLIAALMGFESTMAEEPREKVLKVGLNEGVKLSVSLTPGEVLKLRMVENPSSGYAWVEKSSGGTTGPLKLLESTVTPMDTHFSNTGHNIQIVGAPSTRSFVYKAVEVGHISLKFLYKRGWEESNAEESTVSIIDVEVTEEQYSRN